MARKVSQYNNIAGLNRALRSLPKEATEQLRTASKGIAQMVADEARGRAIRVGGVARHVAPTITATRDRVPAIKMGGSGRLPRGGVVGDVIWGAEYGGQRRPTTQQFQPWRGSSRGAGYFLWPAIRARSDDIDERYSQALLDALQAIH
jgi:hypothetical protein